VGLEVAYEQHVQDLAELDLPVAALGNVERRALEVFFSHLVQQRLQASHTPLDIAAQLLLRCGGARVDGLPPAEAARLVTPHVGGPAPPLSDLHGPVGQHLGHVPENVGPIPPLARFLVRRSQIAPPHQGEGSKGSPCLPSATAIRLEIAHLVPNSLSPKSPRPGTMKARSFSPSSSAAVKTSTSGCCSWMCRTPSGGATTPTIRLPPPPPPLLLLWGPAPAP